MAVDVAVTCGGTYAGGAVVVAPGGVDVSVPVGVAVPESIGATVAVPGSVIAVVSVGVGGGALLSELPRVPR